MTLECPDILGDYIGFAPRYETGGVQYVAHLDSPIIARGGSTELVLLLQSSWNVSVDLTVSVQIPQRTSPLGRASHLRVADPNLTLSLQPAEMGELRIPLASSPKSPAASFNIQVGLQAVHLITGQRVRSPTRHSSLDVPLIRYPQRLQLASSVGLSYQVQPKNQLSLPLQVTKDLDTGEPPDLTPTFTSLWVLKELEWHHRARREFNDGRLYIHRQLALEPLYMSLLEESKSIWAESGVQLRIGEAIFLARILAYTVQYFLENETRLEALMLPIYELALRNGLPTSDALWLLTQLGYVRLLRLAIALSFGLLYNHLGKEPWSQEEQVAVAEFVAESMDKGSELPVEFLYLPLMLGGLLIGSELVMPKENLAQSLRLLARAKQEREAAFDAELEDLSRIFDSLLARALRNAR